MKKTNISYRRKRRFRTPSLLHFLPETSRQSPRPASTHDSVPSLHDTLLIHRIKGNNTPLTYTRPQSSQQTFETKDLFENEKLKNMRQRSPLRKPTIQEARKSASSYFKFRPQSKIVPKLIGKFYRNRLSVSQKADSNTNTHN